MVFILYLLKWLTRCTVIIFLNHWELNTVCFNPNITWIWLYTTSYLDTLSDKTSWAFLLSLRMHYKATFKTLTNIMIFIAGNSIVPNGCNVTVQAISGTGALRVGAAFLSAWFPGNKLVSSKLLRFILKNLTNRLKKYDCLNSH